MKDKINWCKKQSKGIKLILIKNHLSEEYIEDADKTLLEMLKLSGKWKTITAYYACYNALYSILMKCGIKSEIHSCTIELMHLFDFSSEEIDFILNLRDLRIQTQYYLKEKIIDDENKIKDFVLKCKLILNDLNEEKINKIRKELE